MITASTVLLRIKGIGKTACKSNKHKAEEVAEMKTDTKIVKAMGWDTINQKQDILIEK